MLAGQTLLLKVMGHKKLLETNDDVMLQQKLQLRAPYITPLNILQVSASSALVTPADLCLPVGPNTRLALEQICNFSA